MGFSLKLLMASLFCRSTMMDLWEELLLTPFISVALDCVTATFMQKNDLISMGTCKQPQEYRYPNDVYPLWTKTWSQIENKKIYVETSIHTYNYTILNAILFVCADVTKHEECTLLEATPQRIPELLNYWPFVRGIHRSLVDFYIKKTVMWIIHIIVNSSWKSC